MTVRAMLSLLLVGAAAAAAAGAFAPPPSTFTRRAPTAASTGFQPSLDASESGSESPSVPEKVLLVGPSLLQLVVAKHLKDRGIDSLVVCPTNKMDQFKSFVKNGLDAEADAAAEDVMGRALYGLPEESDPLGFGWREGITAVVVCAEDAMIGKGVIDTVMTWDGFGGDRNTLVDGPERAMLCVPISSKVNKEKSMGWIPVFNNDRNEEKIWRELVADWSSNDYVSGKKGSCDCNIIRFGSLFGGSVDGPPELAPLGLNERVYKMSLEQYRDLRERSFDRFRLGAQVLDGDDTNAKPAEQARKEKSLKGEEKEAFVVTGGYPEEDRTNRHTLAAAVVESLCRPVRGRYATGGGAERSVPEEFTVLSKAVGALPTVEEWDEMFKSPGSAEWPDPAEFVMPEVEAVES